jgi:Armadillo/beta-catenin-like repeat-containing protein
VSIVALGGLSNLIDLMVSPNVEVRCNAVGCITNLATHEDNKSKIARSGALGPLTRLARSKDMRVQRNATGALLNMTHSGMSSGVYYPSKSSINSLCRRQQATAGNRGGYPRPGSVAILTRRGCAILLYDRPEQYRRRRCQPQAISPERDTTGTRSRPTNGLFNSQGAMPSRPGAAQLGVR